MNSDTKFIFVILLSILIFTTTPIFSQKIISGFVYNVKDSTVIENVDIFVSSGANWTMTGSTGYFKILTKKCKGNYLSFNRIGYSPLTVKVTSCDSVYRVYLEAESFRMDNIEVTATRIKQKPIGSSLRFNRVAIEAIQANSLGDILKMLPGQTISNPNYTKVSQVNLRLNNNVAGQHSAANSFGTSIIVDGTPISNNAGMQFFKGANASSARANSSVNRGLDLRSIPTNSIESIEVIGGVPGVRHGDVSSGAVIIKNKAGKIPLTIRSSINANAYSLGMINGFKLSDKFGFLSLDFDYLHTVGSPIDPTTVYNRINTGAKWSLNKKFNDDRSFKNTVSMSYSMNIDGVKKDPNQRISSENRSINNRTSLTVFGRLQLNLGILKSINYNLGFTHSYQKTEFQEMKNYHGAPIIDKNKTGTYFTRNLSGNFIQKSQVTGNPMNVYLRMESLNRFTLLGLDHSVTLGGEYRFDSNSRGKKTFTNATVSSTGGGEFNERNLDFKDLPTLKQYSLYLQDYFDFDISKDLKFIVQSGVRYDRMLEFNLFSPRVNASFKICEMFNLRAAWGLFHKSPSIAQLYPKDIYLDKVSKSYFHNDHDKRFTIISTQRIQTEGKHLGTYKGETFELGLDFSYKKWNSSVNGYVKFNRDGIYSNPKLFTYEGYEYGDIHNRDINEYTKSMYFTSLYGVDQNNLYSRTEGLEWTLSTPKIPVINTSFNLQSTYIRTNTKYSKPRIHKNDYQSHTGGFRYGEYMPAIDQNTDIKSMLTMIHHISETGFLITVTGEFFWRSEDKPMEYNTLAPIAWYNRSGDREVITDEMLATGEFKDLMIKPRNREKRVTPFYTNFHLRLTKETKAGHRFSFYANNFLWNRPKVKVDLSFMRMNQPIFYGIDIILKINGL